MNLSAIFQKPIDRPIEGVIKADDAANLWTEIDEYVITNEVAKRLEHFLDAYLDYTGANGVWISGFFGSGKSHLLKMLSLLLENDSVHGQTVLDAFLRKRNVADNAILAGQLKRAAQIPSRSILFNIDQKADVISKKEIDALLAVFVKVFDEMSGYYGKQPYIAQFERDLDSRGQYDAFMQAFEQTAGHSWEKGRTRSLLERNNIADAYASVTGESAESARNILTAYRNQYRLSIEDFAEQVNAYIETQGSDFRLNFFVDEVGQYIADNVKLMTNLQTIAESLATKSRGRAWIIVTAQEDMNTVMGEMGKQQSNDFSKIQARFANRMKLTSADVAEVIRRRLLQKTDVGERQLAALYDQQKNNFRTLFEFADGSQTYRNFRQQSDFVDSYPFIPYQFVLFQAAIRNLSQHNAFEGKHSSVGERSMLGVFQQVAIQIADKQLGELATFDLMFEGLRTALKSSLQAAIHTAERNLDNPFAVRVLKALFLVKYVKEFKATRHNIAVLMLPAFGVDLQAHERRVEEALNLLEQQTYIQRNVNLYEYLTDEEKDVEQEIKGTEVDTQAVSDELAKLIFDGVIKHRKIRYDENGQEYAFTRKLDDRTLGRTHELTIHVISPFHEHAENPSVVRSQAMGRDELLVLLPTSDRLVRDLLMYKRTEKYVNQNLGTAQHDSVRRILSDRQIQNTDREKNLRALVSELVGQATLVAGGKDVDSGSTEPQTRIVRGFHELIQVTYPHLRMLGGTTYRESNIVSYLKRESTLFDDASTYSEAEQEMFSLINRNQNSGLRTSMQTLVDTFERKPYGWYLAAVQCLTAKLLARGKLDLRRDGNLLDEREFGAALRAPHGYANLLLEPQAEFTTGQVRELRDFYSDFFDSTPHANEAKLLAQETADALQALITELKGLRERASDYAFLVALDEPIQQLEAVSGQPYSFYLTKLRKHENALYDDKEDIVAPLREFMHGTRRQIYDEIRSYLQTQSANLSYVSGDAAANLRALLDDPTCYRGQKMQQGKQQLTTLQQQIDAVVAKERDRALETLATRQKMLTGETDFAQLSPADQASLLNPFETLRRDLANTPLIAVIRDRLNQFVTQRYPALLDELRRLAHPPTDNEPADAAQPEPFTYTVTKQSLNVIYEKAYLATEADVDDYLGRLRQEMLEQIEAGKRIQL